MEFGFPETTSSFLKGQDILYSQFNNINFYVEDTEQENFYFVILKKLFPSVVFEKIFPLGGKNNVFDEAGLNIHNNKKVFIVDLDFDQILNQKKSQSNIFYLDRYSIENYLIEIDAIKEIIKEERPKLKDTDINTVFDLNSFMNESKNLFSDLIKYYLVIQKHSLGIENVDQDTARFCDFTKTPACLKASSLTAYHSRVESALNSTKPRLKLSRQLLNFNQHLNSIQNIINNIPGKYILNFLKYRIEHLFSYPQMSLESFTYRLAKNCSLTSLNFLKLQIEVFIQ